MEQAHSLLLNEQSLASCPESKLGAFIYEWLRYLDKILPVTQRADLKQVQAKLLQQLESRLTAQNGPPARKLLSRCIARVYVAGDSYQLFGTINSLNDSLKSKDDVANSLSIKLTALTCLAALYERVGRLVGRTYEESFTIMVKWLKSAESQGRAEILNTLSHLVTGLGPAASNIHKELNKTVRQYLTDRVPSVRIAAVNCICSLIPLYTPLYTSDLEATCTLAVKSLMDGSNYETRVAVAKLFSILLSTALQPPAGATMGGSKSHANIPIRPMATEDALQLLATSFLRGGIGGFLKGGGAGAIVGGQKEVRVGVAMGYVELVREMGATWLERNLGVFCKHMVELAAKSGGVAYTNNASQATEAVLLRKCVSYVLRSTLGGLLSEQTQITACKYLGALLAEQINQLDYVNEPGAEPSLGLEAFVSSQAAIVILLEISALVRQIGTAVTPLFVEASGIMEPIFECLLHPVAATRAATAWCLRSVTLAVPGQLTPLIDRCLSRLEHMRASPDAISGYSLALAALIAASADCNLGIPHGKPKQVMQCAEDMLKTATQQSRLAVAKINAGWTLLHSLVSIGSPETRDNLPRLCQLWRAAFPRSVKEADAEKAKGDAFTWQCALESRAGALSVMVAAASHKDLSTDDVIKSMLVPLECSLVMMSQVGSLIRSFGNKMRQLICVVRVRAYRLTMLLPVKALENLFPPLLRELVADLTLSDNINASQCTSICSQVCSGAESVLLTPWLAATDESMIEDAIQSPSGSIGTLENDFTSLVTGSARDMHNVWPEEDQPQAACLDAAVLAYARVFALMPAKHKLQIMEHFTEVIKKCKEAPRKQAIQQNVICAIASSFRSVCEQRGRVESAPLQNASFALLVGGLCSPLAVTRCVAAEGIGRLAQAVGDAQYVASVAQFCFNKLKAGDAASKSGYALALGSLHRHVGSLGSGQHLNTGVSVILALAQNSNLPLVQSWSLVSLALIAETGGGMFRGYVEPVLSACLTLLLNTVSANVEVVLGIGKLLSALMTCVGPELGCSGAIEGVRESLLAACAIQLSHPDPLVRSEAMAGLQQMHLYAPRHVHLSHLVQDIAHSLSSRHLCIRNASVCCLRQLVQREAKEVREHAQVLVPQGVVDEGKKLPLPDTGLEGALFAMLDTETQPVLRTHLQETIISLVQATSGELLSNWLSLCKEILASNSDTARSTLVVEEKNGDEEDDENEGGDDDATLQGARSLAVNDKGKLHPRWPTRVFATQVVQRLMSVCDTERAHLDLALAKELQMSSNGRCDYLVLHLSDLVRMSFMGATSDNTPLRLAGLQSLQEVINRFSAVPEPEFPGHVILEQFQAQVGAALRPAFSEDTPSDVTAAACQVCSTWIGSGVARDLNDLRRVHHLLVSSLNKLRDGSTGTQLYSEAAATLEKLSILKAWAEVYVTAEEQQKQQAGRSGGDGGGNGNHNHDSEDELPSSSSSESLLSLVRPELTTLVGFWLAALHDAAALSLPSKYSDQLPPEGGAFYKAQSAEVCRQYYRSSWPPLLLATSVWLRQNNFELPENSEAPPAWPTESASSRFHVMMGLAVEALCSKTAFGDDVPIQMCVRAITSLLSCEWCQRELMSDVQLSIELCNVLHRLILTRDCLSTQQHCIDCSSAIMAAAQLAIKQGTSDDLDNGNVSPGHSNGSPLSPSQSAFRGEEGKEGLRTGSLSYALIELCLCLFVRQMPQINSAQMKSRSVAPLHLRRFGRLPAESAHLVRSGIQLMVQLPSLCCPSARLSILPVILYLLIGFIRESARIDENSVVPELPPGHLTLVATASLQALRSLASAPPTDSSSLSQWCSIIRSCLYSILLLSDGSGSCSMDNCVVMLSSVVVASVAPRQVVLGHGETVQRLVRLVGQQIRSDNSQVVVKALQSLSSLVSRRDISAPFSRHLAPTVIQCIRPYVSDKDSQQRAKDITDEELAVVQEAFKVLELLAAAADEKNKLSVVSLLTQSLSRLLVASSPDNWRLLSLPARRLHEWAIARLNAVAPLWPNEFKKILASHSQLKSRLEAALLLQANRLSQANAAASLKQNEASKMAASAACQQPTIKLTMDFNSFGKSA